MEVSRELVEAVARAESAMGAYKGAKAGTVSMAEGGGASAPRVPEALEMAIAELWAAADALNLAREAFTRDCLDECGDQFLRQQHASTCDTWRVLFGLLTRRMGGPAMPVANSQSLVSAQSVGAAGVKKLAGAIDTLAASIDEAAANAHPELGEFGEKLRVALESPAREPGQRRRGTRPQVGCRSIDRAVRTG
jgi:hypothetical protein